MFKRVALAIALLGLTSSTFASFYVGPKLSLINNSSQNGNYRAIQPEIHVGFSDLLSSYSYMGIEAFYAPTSFILNENTPNRDGLRSTYSYGVSIIPGYLITDNVYGTLRLGLLETKFSVPNESEMGGQIGIGILTPLTDEWNLTFEYVYSGYSSADGIGSVKTDQVLLGVDYHFIY